MSFKNIIGKSTLAAAATALLAGCATPEPALQTGPDAEVSFDGLTRVENSRADAAWARADLDLSRYSKIMVVSAGFEYTDASNRGRTATERSRGGPFVIDEQRRERFEALVNEVWTEELQKLQHFEFVTEPGPDVLMLRGALLDIETNVPDTDQMAGRSRVYVSYVGEATLVLELRDSQTGAILARSVDRRAAERMGGQLFESNRVTNAAEVRRLMRFWAQRLVESLDGFAGRSM